MSDVGKKLSRVARGELDCTAKATGLNLGFRKQEVRQKYPRLNLLIMISRNDSVLVFHH